jgi:hypothetical protein
LIEERFHRSPREGAKKAKARQALVGRASWGAAVLRPYVEGRRCKKEEARMLSGPQWVCSKLGISGGRRRDHRLHRGSRRHLHRRVNHHLRRCCAERYHHLNCGSARVRSYGPAASRNVKARSKSAVSGSSNAGSNRSATEIRSNGRCRFRNRGRIGPTCYHDHRHRLPSLPNSNRPRADDPYGRARRCLPRRCSSDCCRILAARYRGQRSCPALPMCERSLKRGWSSRDCWSIADAPEKAASDAKRCIHLVASEPCGSRRYCLVARRRNCRSYAARVDARPLPPARCAP